MIQAETGSGTLGTATLALMMAYDVELEVVGVLRHVTPESWIDVQLSGVSSGQGGLRDA